MKDGRVREFGGVVRYHIAREGATRPRAGHFLVEEPASSAS